MKKASSIFIFLALFSQISNAQKNVLIKDTGSYIEGRVLGDSEKPIPNASVYLQYGFIQRSDIVGTCKVLVPKEYVAKHYLQCYTDSLGRYKLFIPDSCLNKEIRIVASADRRSSTMIDFFLPKLPYQLNIPINWNIHSCRMDTIIVDAIIIYIDGQKIPKESASQICSIGPGHPRSYDDIKRGGTILDSFPGIFIRDNDPSYYPANVEGPTAPLPQLPILTPR